MTAVAQRIRLPSLAPMRPPLLTLGEWNVERIGTYLFGYAAAGDMVLGVHARRDPDAIDVDWPGHEETLEWEVTMWLEPRLHRGPRLGRIFGTLWLDPSGARVALFEEDTLPAQLTLSGLTLEAIAMEVEWVLDPYLQLEP